MAIYNTFHKHCFFPSLNWPLVRLLVFSVVLLFTSSLSASDSDNSQIDPKAFEALKRTSAYISSIRNMSLEVNYNFDVVQADGQKIEFGGSRNIHVKRPDQFRADVSRLDGGQGRIIFSNQKVILVDDNEKVFSQAKHTGNLESALDFITEELAIPLPLRDLLDADPIVVLTQGLFFAAYVGKTTISGIDCDHLAFRTDKVDYQLWISNDDKPLPMRVVINYKNLPGQPQFRAYIRNWKVNIELPDKLFQFNPTPDLEHIPFVAPPQLSYQTGSE